MTERIQHIILKNAEPTGNLVSIIIPVYNEEECIESTLVELLAELKTQIDFNFEITFMDDGSEDSTPQKIESFFDKTPQNVKISLVQLAHNSGSHIAITAGLNLCNGDFAIVISGDGQDPPSLIKEMLQQWRSGNRIVLAYRNDNLDQGPFSKFVSKTAWKLMKWSANIKVPKNGCDVVGLDRKVLNSFNQMDERNTMFLYRILSLGYSFSEFGYIKRARSAGKSKWTFLKKVKILVDSVSGFSNRPLLLITKIGLLAFALIFFRWLYVVYHIYILNTPVSEFNIIANIIYTATALQVLLLGVIGNYIWRILDETRKRPYYNIKDASGKYFRDGEE